MRLIPSSITFLLLGCLGVLAACTTTAPRELAHARMAYQRASSGPAAQFARAEMQEAKAALNRAEQAFADEPVSQRTRDLAYVAERRAELAEVLAFSSTDKEKARDLKAALLQLMQGAKDELVATGAELAAAERSGEGEAQGRLIAEKKATDDQQRAKLADLAPVTQEERGLVITLSGSLLFAPNQDTLLPYARTMLSEVAHALMTTKERGLLIEAHSDSRGTDRYNLDLSQQRAETVRAYLVSRGYESDRIRAQGIGKGRPVADNTTAEGRANNRRVEIIVEPAIRAER